MDVALVVRREQAQVEKIDLALFGHQHLVDEPGKTKGLRDFAGAGAVVAWRAANDECAGLCLRVGPDFLRALHALAGLDPIDRQVVVGVGVAGTGLPCQGRFTAIAVRLPSNRFQPADRHVFAAKGRVEVRRAKALAELDAFEIAWPLRLSYLDRHARLSEDSLITEKG